MTLATVAEGGKLKNTIYMNTGTGTTVECATMAPRTDHSSESPLLDDDETGKLAYSSIDINDTSTSSQSHGQPSSSGWTPTQQRMHRIGIRWKKYCLPFVFITTLLLPIAIFRHGFFSFLAHTWFAPLMGIVACAIPSGGAPVAGGVVFLPVLSMVGLEPHDAVGFAAATQMFGVGIFAPLGWMSRDPTVLMGGFLRVALPYALGGLLTGLLLVPLEQSEEVMWAFTVFVFFLAWYTVQGLVSKKLDVSGAESEPVCCPGDQHDDDNNSNDSNTEMSAHPQEKQLEALEGGDATSAKKVIRKSKAERRKIKFTRKEYVIYALTCYFGGILTAWIGIGVEKLTFILLTYYHDVDVTAAGVSSICLTGILSAVAFFFHSVCASAEDGPGPHLQCALKSTTDPTGNVFGNVPYEILLAVLPGILVGSMVGPTINTTIGPRNMMLLFVLFLIFDIGYNLVDLLG